MRAYLIATIILASMYGCFGSVPSYYSRDNWKTAEEAKKIQIIKTVNSFYNASASQFTMDDWKKYGYDNKIGIVNEIIQSARDDGIIIELPSSFYVKELDLIMLNFITSKDNDSLRNTSIGITFHALAAMEGDWGNGINKCEHAKDFLGEDAFADLKQLFPDKYNKLCKPNTDEKQSRI